MTVKGSGSMLDVSLQCFEVYLGVRALVIHQTRQELQPIWRRESAAAKMGAEKAA